MSYNMPSKMLCRGLKHCLMFAKDGRLTFCLLLFIQGRHTIVSNLRKSWNEATEAFK